MNLKILRGIALTFLYFVVFFIAMVGTAISLHEGWLYVFGFLACLWLVYFICSLCGWKFLSTLVLAAFLGYGTAILRDTDRFTGPGHALWIDWIPADVLVYSALVFYFIFIALLPSSASMLADKCKAKFNPAAQEKPESFNPYGRDGNDFPDPKFPRGFE